MAGGSAATPSAQRASTTTNNSARSRLVISAFAGPLSPRLAGNAENFLQPLAIIARQRQAEFVELGAVAIQFDQQRFAIGEADVAPHFRMAGGDPREIAETGGSESEEQVGILAHGQIVDQRERQQVRQVADRGEDAVMRFRRQFVDVGAAQRPSSLDVVERIVGVFRQGCDNDLPAAIEIPTRRRRAAVFGTGDRVGRHELADPLAEGGARRGNDIAFGRTRRR